MTSQIEEIKSKLDIVTVVQSYVPTLKHTGRNWFGLCPFHSEKSPSFSVNPELGIFKCFGCGEGGDVIRFLEKMEGLDFREALQLAADKAGIELVSINNPQAKALAEEKERALKAHKLAAEYYHYLLLKHTSGKDGLKYATEKRKITLEMIEKFQLGFAPKHYHNLEIFLTKKGFSKNELLKFGLAAERNGRIYDKFRGRLMHPIMDIKGRVVAFSGRAIYPDDPGPKYLNSPETLIYHKKELPYGLYQAKDAIRTAKFVILVEGNIDVVSSARVGIANIICPLGTALTPEQLRILKRYATEVYFAFDTDAAGKKALLRALDLTDNAKLQAKAITIGTYKDVDEMVVADPVAWKKAVTEALEIPEYVMETFRADYDLSQAEEKLKYIDTCLPYLAVISNQIKLDHYLHRLNQITGTEYEILVSELNRIKNNNSEPKQNEEVSTNSVIDVARPIESQSKNKIPRKLKLIINFILQYRDNLVDLEGLKEVYFHNLPRLESALIESALAGKICAEDEIASNVRELLADSAELKSDPMSLESAQQEVREMLVSYVTERLKSFLRSIKQQLSSSENPQLYLERIKVYTQKLKDLR